MLWQPTPHKHPMCHVSRLGRCEGRCSNRHSGSRMTSLLDDLWPLHFILVWFIFVVLYAFLDAASFSGFKNRDKLVQWQHSLVNFQHIAQTSDLVGTLGKRGKAIPLDKLLLTPLGSAKNGLWSTSQKIGCLISTPVLTNAIVFRFRDVAGGISTH